MHSLNNIIQGAPEWSGGLQFDRCQIGSEPERVFNGMTPAGEKAIQKAE